jgi:hypothetical protein
MKTRPSMSAAMRRVVLRYADWWTGPSAAPPSYRPQELAEWVSRIGGSNEDLRDVLYSLAYDNTDGPKGGR